MRRVQVLGTGCAKCSRLAENTQTAVSELNLEANIEKISDITEILSFGVPGTPALVVDGKVMVAGRVASAAEIKAWLERGLAESSCQSQSGAVCSCEGRQTEEVNKPCCGPAVSEKDWSTESDPSAWITGTIDTPTGPVPQIDTSLNWTDHIGTWKSRWGIRRMQYWVKPRLYAVGNPTTDSSVMVSANYKMSFDRLRSALRGIDAWILVLDTKGVNVWCAAGKGTFGTDELIRQIGTTRLPEIVSHNRLIVPQLGAPGVAAHEVQRRAGFRVVYGPVRAEDIPAFLQTDMKATPRMRRVEFPLVDRLAVVPVEVVQSSKWALLIAAAFLLLGGLGPAGYSWSQVFSTGLAYAVLFLLAYAFGTIIAPALLPWLPGRPLALKGLWTGLGLCAMAGIWKWQTDSASIGSLEMMALALVILATTSFTAMKFTGSTTYTSLSGVRREMCVAVPLQIATSVIGMVLWTVSRFI